MKPLASKEHLISLYLTYSPLLTKTQADYFYAHYFLDHSLAEIAENEGVSRNAIFLSLKQTERKLVDFEIKLKLVKKTENLHKRIKNISDKYQIPLKEFEDIEGVWLCFFKKNYILKLKFAGKIEKSAI